MSHCDGDRYQSVSRLDTLDKLLQRYAIDEVHQQIGTVVIVTDIQHTHDIVVANEAGKPRLVEKHRIYGGVLAHVRQEALLRIETGERPLTTNHHRDFGDTATRQRTHMPIAAAFLTRRPV